MNTKQFTISILKEARADENRAPFTPDQIKTLITNFPNIKILVQPSKKRCFKDKEYYKAGAKLDEDITNSNIIFGIKEIDISKIIEDKTYLFFSHTSKVPNGNFQNSQNPNVHHPTLRRSPQSSRYRFLRFRARESPCMAHKRQKRCLQIIPDVFMHRQLAQLRLSSEKEQFCHHFDVSPY